MSATINAKKIKFHVLGNGFDNVRNDSGKGLPAPDYHDLSGMTLACIDQTNTYVWLTDEGNWLHKIKLDTWEFQSHSLPIGSIHHPCNVENNYGVDLVSYSRIVIFDLTSGAIIKDISGSYSKFYGISDCILVDDDIYLVRVYPQNSDSSILHISLNDETISEATIWNNCVSGFVDNNTIYSHWQKVWFSSNSNINGIGLDGGGQWYASEDVGQGATFAVPLQGICGNGRIYVPTPKGGVWTLGAYDGNTAPNFITPAPIKTFGNFGSQPNIQWQYSRLNYCYTQGKTKCAFATDIGTFLTDFTSLEKLEDNPSNMQPLAMNDSVIVSRAGNNQISVTYI